MAAEDDVVVSDEESLSFEQASERLAAIVGKLESGELRLEDSLKLFEEGVRVARSAQDQLDRAEKRVEELVSVEEDGQARTQDFE
jgi:exodeoxyribonuclease VII small subunit